MSLLVSCQARRQATSSSSPWKKVWHMQSFHHTYSVNLCFDAVSLKAWFEILSHSQFFFFPFPGRKTQQMTFSSDYRPEVLTEALVSLGIMWCHVIPIQGHVIQIQGHVILPKCHVTCFFQQRFSPLFCDNTAAKQEKVGTFDNVLVVLLTWQYICRSLKQPSTTGVRPKSKYFLW